MPPKKHGTKVVTKAAGKVKVIPVVNKTSDKKRVVVAKKGKEIVSKEPEADKNIWTEKDDAAVKIQCKMRQYLSKKSFHRLKKEKEEYEEKMATLEKEAFVRLVKMEQEQAEKERQKEDAERRRRKDEALRKKRMLEAAFDGDVDEMKIILKEVSNQDMNDSIGDDLIGTALRNKHQLDMVDCEDANDNTPLSEAANGGNACAVKFLLGLGADPNSRGQFLRTPLYRAAFAGNMEACQVLLDNGADPRLYADDGQTPQHVASVNAVTELIGAWDVSQTEYLLKKLAGEKEKRLEEMKRHHEAEQAKLENNIEELTKDHHSKQKQLDRAYCELNKRIKEHDLAVAEGFARPDLTIAAIQDAETDLEIKKLAAEKSRDKLAKTKLELRIKQKEGSETANELPGMKVNIRELDDVLMKDVGNVIRDSGKWPMLIDETKQASTFLRYRDTNYLNALNTGVMEPDKIRLALLGALRFGKPLVLDMMEVDMFDTVSDRFDEIKKGLMATVMDKSILQSHQYEPLIKEADGPNYDKCKFIDGFISNFMFILVTQNPFPPEKLVELTYPIRVIVST